MKGVAALTFAAALAIGLAGCASDHAPRPAVTVTVTATPGATSTASTAARGPASATANERMLVDGLDETIALIPASMIAGPLMRAYANSSTPIRRLRVP
jgi:hypothetical protein